MFPLFVCVCVLIILFKNWGKERVGFFLHYSLYWVVEHVSVKYSLTNVQSSYNEFVQRRFDYFKVKIPSQGNVCLVWFLLPQLEKCL